MTQRRLNRLALLITGLTSGDEPTFPLTNSPSDYGTTLGNTCHCTYYYFSCLYNESDCIDDIALCGSCLRHSGGRYRKYCVQYFFLAEYHAKFE